MERKHQHVKNRGRKMKGKQEGMGKKYKEGKEEASEVM